MPALEERGDGLGPVIARFNNLNRHRERISHLNRHCEERFSATWQSILFGTIPWIAALALRASSP